MKRFQILFAVFLTILILPSCLFAQAEQVSQEVLTLDQCIRIDLKNNVSVINAENSYKAAKNNVWTAWGNFLPRMDTWLTRQRTKVGPTGKVYYDPETGKIFTGEAILYSWSAGLTASQTLFNGGSNIYNLFYKKADQKSAYQSLVSARQNLILSVKGNYFALLKAKMLLEIQKEAVKRGEEQLKIAQSRYELGSASLSDVLKAKVQYGNEKLVLASAENSLKLAKANLNYILDQDVDTPIDVKEDLTKPELGFNYSQAVKEALSHNPSILKAHSGVSSAKAQLGMARAGWLPSLTLRSTYSWSHPHLDEIGQIIKRNYQWSISGSLGFNIFEGFQTKTNVSNAKVGLNSAKEGYQEVKNQIALEVKKAYLAVEEAEEKIKLTEEGLRSAEEDLNLTQEKYNLGAASILELLDANVSYGEAKNSQVEALYDYNLAVAQFEKAIGK